MTDATTPRLGLPLMAAGQAQKEVTHNEALLLIDAVTNPRIEAPPTNQPPLSPGVGQCWLVGSAPVGSWTGNAHAMACWTIGGWRFVTVPVGTYVFLAATGAGWRRISAGWLAPAQISAPVGGPIIDSECRATLSAIITALTDAGLVIV